eukprot:CAMPEP_0175224838 /NCGR_PEP_ID=MMETSP0093-20121207/22059_1 /TAXON_ID=311494 /ORGANISM="Alexandrium monilatum, Strain CCMP3105" /LENGTH=90 /DNA_ID=CAMNT_0016518495 /DNA_START=219 /DNA_END=488 /DNA_ORIENTATION=-
MPAKWLAFMSSAGEGGSETSGRFAEMLPAISASGIRCLLWTFWHAPVLEHLCSCANGSLSSLLAGIRAESRAANMLGAGKSSAGMTAGTN